MSLWTPDGERPVPPSGAPRSEPDTAEIPEADRETAEALAAEMAEVRARLAEAPASVIVANHAMGFYELAAIHLSQQPPRLADAQLAIDAMGAVLDRLAGRLGDVEPTLRDARSQIQLAFVQVSRRAEQDSATSSSEQAPETEG